MRQRSELEKRQWEMQVGALLWMSVYLNIKIQTKIRKVVRNFIDFLYIPTKEEKEWYYIAKY